MSDEDEPESLESFLEARARFNEVRDRYIAAFPGRPHPPVFGHGGTLAYFTKVGMVRALDEAVK